MAEVVSTQSTVFTGWTQTELESLLRDIKAQVRAEGLDYVTGASVNGKNVQQGQRMSLKEWMYYIREALQELDPDLYGARRQTVFAVSVPFWMNK